MTCSEPSLTCTGCSRLSRCARVTADMLIDGDRCELYEASQPGEEAARYRVLRELGPYALLPKPNPRIKPDENTDMNPSRKPTLRQLATEVGLLDKNDPHIWSKEKEDLLALLRPKYPGIDDMEEDAVKDLLASVKEGGGRAKDDKKADEPSGRRGRGRAEEPAPEPPKEESRGGRRGRGGQEEEAPPPTKEEPKSEGGRRGRGRRAEASDEGEKVKAETKAETKADAVAPSSDNTQVLTLLETLFEELKTLGGELKTIGNRLTKLEGLTGENAKELEGLVENLGKLDEKVDEVHVGVESLYLSDINEKDESLADVLNRVNG